MSAIIICTMFCIFSGNSSHRHIESTILWAKILFFEFGSLSIDAIAACSISFPWHFNAMFDVLKVRPVENNSPQKPTKLLDSSIHSAINNDPVKTWRRYKKEVVETAKGKAIQLEMLR